MLIKELNDRQLSLNDKLCLYIVKRMCRSYKAVSILAKKLDQLSLEEKKPINFKQVRDILNS